MSEQRIEREWEEYLHDVIDKSFHHPFLLTALRLTFYAGAMSIFREIVSTRDQEMMTKIVLDLQAEIKAHVLEAELTAERMERDEPQPRAQ